MSLGPEQRLLEKLAEQVRFLRNSARYFDDGSEEEALRLATSMRVLFHQTNSSTSLLTHLQLTDALMLSSSRGYRDWRDYLGHEIDLRLPQPIRMLPVLGDQFVPLPFSEWWNGERVFMHNGVEYSRKKIILSAANKDGGAHVDTDLEQYYQVLCLGEYALGITGNLQFDGVIPFPQGVTIYPKNAHLCLLRQFAHETLSSIEYFGWLKR